MEVRADFKSQTPWNLLSGTRKGPIHLTGSGTALVYHSPSPPSRAAAAPLPASAQRDPLNVKDCGTHRHRALTGCTTEKSSRPPTSTSGTRGWRVLLWRSTSGSAQPRRLRAGTPHREVAAALYWLLLSRRSVSSGTF